MEVDPGGYSFVNRPIVGRDWECNRKNTSINERVPGGKFMGEALTGDPDDQGLRNLPAVDARYLWQMSDLEVLIVQKDGWVLID
jgi:hypothetical protein